MKIDKRNPWHWLCLALFLCNVLLALILRPILHRRRSGRVLMYGHKLAGNLLPIHRLIERDNPSGLCSKFLTMDPAYHRELRMRGEESLLAIAPGAIAWLATADAVVSDHGLHAMQPMLRLSDMKFFDVWHGIPFKGFDADDFRLQHRYDEVWVASDLCRELYVERFGFDPARVCATGYARTDRLLVHKGSDTTLRDPFGIPHGRRTILFAPTWAQDDRGRSIYPFGCTEEEFMGALSTFAGAHAATVLLRSHLNSGDSPVSEFPDVIALPGSRYPDTEAILLASDVLVCDWSSIAFDFLLLDRPTVFLDVPPPFRKGFSLDAEYRFGSIVRDLPDLMRQLDICVRDPDAYRRVHAGEHQRARHDVYGDKADGHSASRCIERLQTRLGQSAI